MSFSHGCLSDLGSGHLIKIVLISSLSLAEAFCFAILALLKTHILYHLQPHINLQLVLLLLFGEFDSASSSKSFSPMGSGSSFE